MAFPDTAPEQIYHREVPLKFVPEETLHAGPQDQSFEAAIADRDEVHYGLSKIPPDQKAVLELLFLESAPPAEIIQILQKKPSEVVRTALRGLQSMRTVLHRTRSRPFELLDREPDTTLQPLPDLTIRTTSIKGWRYHPHLDQQKNPKH